MTHGVVAEGGVSPAHGKQPFVECDITVSG